METRWPYSNELRRVGICQNRIRIIFLFYFFFLGKPMFTPVCGDLRRKSASGQLGDVLSLSGSNYGRHRSSSGERLFSDSL